MLLKFLALIIVAATTAMVVELSDATFEEAIRAHEFVMVHFYDAQHSAGSRRLATAAEFEEAAEILSIKKPSVFCAQVDASTNPELAERYQVRNPQMLWLK